MDMCVCVLVQALTCAGVDSMYMNLAMSEPHSSYR